MKHTVPHDLDFDTARRVTEKAFAAYEARFPEYKPVMTWVTDQRAETSFTVKGVTLKGTFELVPHGIDMDLDVPFLLRPFKGKAIAVIEEEVRAWVGKAKRGEL